MMEHQDEKQDVDMIKSVLQKIIDEMNQFESDRIMPADRKKAVITEIHAEGSPEEEVMESPEEDKLEPMELYKGSYGIPKPNEDKGESVEQAEPENQFNQHEDLDPTVLTELLKKADEADEDGVMPEERENDLPLELEKLVREKKSKK
jgi:hypothetical protein